MIRRITSNDLEAFRETRLRALADSPASFGSTYAEEAERSEEAWRDRVERASTGNDRAMFLAFDGAECVGLAGGIEDDYDADRQLVSMWVAPAHRGTDIATELVEAVLGWAAEGGARTIALWVTRGNVRAQRFYERMGFRITGEVQPLPSDPCKDEIRMVRELDLRAQLRARLAAAMKQRDPIATRSLRTTIAAIDNAEAATVNEADLPGFGIDQSPQGVGATEVARNRLAADQVRELVRREIDERLDAAEGYDRSGEEARAAELRAEAAVLAEIVGS
ncbi:MAG: GNAT family N-acetyltransferase [Mycobacteriales bacterium]